MNRPSGLILALAVSFLGACASTGGMGAAEGDGGNSPRENDLTRAASVHLVQASTAQGEAAQTHYQEALQSALQAISADSTNPKAYLLAGQAAVGLEDWTQADSMFTHAQDLYPGYADQVASEREQAWVNAYNAGAAALQAGDTDKALAYFQGADLVYQARPEARIALGSLYSRTGQPDKALEAYEGALEILNGPIPEGMGEEQAANWRDDRQGVSMSAAQLAAQTGNYQEASDILGNLLAKADSMSESARLSAMTAQAGYLAQAGHPDQAEAIYDTVLARPDLSSDDYFQIGIGFFNTGDYDRAASAFDKAAQMNPYSRDALLNLVQSLYSQATELEKGEATPERNQQLNDIYDRILTAAQQVRDFDPLNRNLLSFMLRAYRGKAELASGSAAQELTQKTQQLYRTYQGQKYEVNNINLSLLPNDQAKLTGEFTNLAGTAGEQVQIRFQVLNKDGQTLDTKDVTVTVPEENQAVDFDTTVSFPSDQFGGWKYEIVS